MGCEAMKKATSSYCDENGDYLEYQVSVSGKTISESCVFPETGEEQIYQNSNKKIKFPWNEKCYTADELAEFGSCIVAKLVDGDESVECDENGMFKVVEEVSNLIATSTQGGMDTTTDFDVPDMNY